MNKKFSTLMAGLMLASAFSVAEAQDVVSKYEKSKTYWLAIGTEGSTGGTATNVIAVISDPEAPNYGQLVSVPVSALDDINAVKAATWSIVLVYLCEQGDGLDAFFGCGCRKAS